MDSGCRAHLSKIIADVKRNSIFFLLFFIDSVQDGSCADEIPSASEHAHYADYHVSLL